MSQEAQQCCSVRIPYDHNRVTITHTNGDKLELTKDEALQLCQLIIRRLRQYPGGMIIDIEAAIAQEAQNV